LATPILEVIDLSVAFGATTVLRGVTFSVEPGAALAVIGPNGAGKTVLFRALVGATAHQGTVRWAPGTRLGYVPQKLDLERDVPITGLDFLSARAALGRARPMTEALAWVGLSADTVRIPIGELSGGQFQRLLIAFALIGDPTVLLLDEPTAGVDEPGQERLNELVRRLQAERGLTVIFISHELTVVAKYATRVLCLSRTSASFGAPVDVLSGDMLQQLYGTPVALHLHEH
jgi:zinc transport system ATP-binding protein